jgi:mRNA interferase MazF
MPFDFGDILLLPFPFTDQTASKKCPAAVVSSRAYYSARRNVVVVAITSQLHPDPAAGEAWVKDWKLAGFLKPSAVKPVFATIEQGLVIRKLGVLSDTDKESLTRLIAKMLG